MTVWPVKTLGDICRIEMGRTPSRGDSRGWDKEFKTSNHWASIADLTACSGSVLTSTKERISDFAAETTRVVPAGTLMMSFKLSIGKLAFAGCDLYTNEAIAAFHLPENADVDPAFLYRALSVIDWSALTKGSEKVKGATMNKAKLNLLKIPVPPLDEQKRLVALLDAATARVTEITACYEQARTHAKNLFTSALRGALESNSNWLSGTLDDLCEVEYGTRVTRKRDGGTKYPVYGGGGATFNLDDFNRQDQMIVSRFAMSEECVRFVSGKFFLNDSGLTVRTRDANILSQEFLDQQLLARSREIYATARGTAQKNMDMTMFRSMELSYPDSLAEQNRIVARLDLMRVKTSEMMDAYDAKLQAAKNLRQSILESAFEGKL